jgi:hypothetical protein
VVDKLSLDDAILAVYQLSRDAQWHWLNPADRNEALQTGRRRRHRAM